MIDKRLQGRCTAANKSSVYLQNPETEPSDRTLCQFGLVIKDGTYMQRVTFPAHHVLSSA